MQDLSFPYLGDIWELARQVKNDLSPQQSLDRIARSRLEFRQIFANARDAETTIQIVRQGQGLEADFVLSNMGNLSLEREYGRLQLEAMWGPAILIGTFPNQQVLGIATVNGRLSLLYCSHTPIPLFWKPWRAYWLIMFRVRVGGTSIKGWLVVCARQVALSVNTLSA
jgi:hypothetical protein